METNIAMLEQSLQEDNTPANRTNLNKAKAEYVHHLKIQEAILRQKARVRWLKDGDANSAYFHRVIKNRRRRLSINKIMDENQQWVEGNDKVAEAGVRYFKGIFSQTPEFNDYSNLEAINIMITEENNVSLIEIPSEEEIKSNLMSMDPNSVPGPDGFTAMFFQSCWDLVAYDITNAFYAFFCGANLPKWLNHTCIAMIPKVNSPQSFSDMRPISLCNVISKKSSKVLNSRLSKILPSLISNNQSGFIKGRSIIENVLLAQEIIQDIDKLNFNGNVVLKLDMAKAYDRRLQEILRTDDGALSTYEKVSGQMVNKQKSSVSISPKEHYQAITKIKEITGIVHKSFPIKYLGCPLYVGRKTTNLFSDMMGKILNKIGGWHTKILSVGGRAVLIKHVLLSMPIYFLAVMQPPIGVMNQIERMLNKFFWGGTYEVKKHHWASWEKMCYPYEEGGVAFRRIHDICAAFTVKQWWNLRARESLWGDFILAKYCQRIHPVKKKWYSGNSQSWNAMCKVKVTVDKHIIWKIGRGEVSMWYDNWSGIGALWTFLAEGRIPRNDNLSEILLNGH
ncbi:hypothetical protein MTR67_035439 [Solanum verrucosum]|uniref:Reverse transcriptase domain-containing protein n=1 Tax=Solanum verrucosum TaxID=315347 RepID=A0AAF0UA65_SOLVR|nr:hypothetical protein MTR67_035439 [Solanum verrucosum]